MQKDFTKKAVTIKGVNGKNKEIPISTIATIISARAEEILGGIAYEIDAVRKNTAINGGLVITGGTAKLKNLLQLAKFSLAIEARTGTPLFTGPEYASECYATAIGLIIKGMEYTEDIIARQRKKAEQANAEEQQKEGGASTGTTDAKGGKNGKDQKANNGKESSGGFRGLIKSIANKLFTEPDDSKM